MVHVWPRRRWWRLRWCWILNRTKLKVNIKLLERVIIFFLCQQRTFSASLKHFYILSSLIQTFIGVWQTSA